jgi:hypothetical protein
MAVMAVVGPSGSRKREAPEGPHEVNQPETESVLMTRTAPPGPRWIEVSHWEDLVRASRFMGRPILRLDDGTRELDQPLFYVPDGPQSYVYDFRREGVRVSTSGGYLMPSAPEPALTTEPASSPATEEPEWVETPSAPEAPATTEPPASDTADLGAGEGTSIPTDEIVEQYLGPAVREPGEFADLAEATKVERNIRDMIQQVVTVLRHLPASSDVIEPGSMHVRRALELLHRGRYGSAQIEVNRAARLLLEGPPT